MSEPSWSVFDRDAATHAGYLYTATTQLSSRLATQRSTQAILDCGRFQGRSVLDVGCGDGFYSLRFWDASRPRRWVGVDPAEHAIRVANENKQDRPMEFVVGDAHRLPYDDDSFDLVLVQSILHHDDDPPATLREALRVAPEILIHEPNGNNLGLKVIEKASRYHREHAERSYSSWRLRRWVRAAGGRVVQLRFAGFVPMFCADGLARRMKAIEPALERMPVIRALVCSVTVMVARRTPAPRR